MESFGLFGLETLADFGARSGVNMRPTLLRILTDLYVQKLTHTPDEERHYTELALRLLDDVDVPTRTAVAARLARHMSPPVRIIQRLANDRPEVAAALVVHPLLQQAGERRTAAQGPLVAPQPATDVTAQLARDGAEDVKAPATIDAATAVELNELFLAADAKERRLILLNLDIVTAVPDERIGVRRDPALLQRLETTALARNREGFAQHLAALLRIPHRQAQRIVADDLGEPIVVAAKALGLARDVLYRILMFLNPAVGHSVERVHALAELYDEMTSRSAADLVAIWQALRADNGVAAKHQPALWSDETRAQPRTAAIPHRQSVPGRQFRREAS